MAARGPLDHYDVDENDDCTCRYCNVWRVRRDVVNRFRMLFDARRCRCANCTADPKNTVWKCLHYQKSQYQFLASANRRELWTEMSFHGKFGTEQDGLELMDWLDRKIRSMEHREGWWALHAERHSLDYWFCQFDDFVRLKAKATLAVEMYGKHKRLACAPV